MPARPEAPRGRARVAISLGDPAGIGPEIVAAALAHPGVRRSVSPVVFGDDGAFAAGCAAMGVDDELPRIDLGDAVPPRGALVRVSRLAARDRTPARPTLAGARAQVLYIEEAI